MLQTTLSSAFGQPNASLDQDQALLPAVVAAVEATGNLLLQRFGNRPEFRTRDGVVAAIHANDDAALSILRPALTQARPQAGWAEDELESGPLPGGEWWVTDPVEGNINHIHGMTDWGVTATLVRDNLPVLTAVHLPLLGTTYTAVQGGGAFQDGAALRASAKSQLDGALVGTGQARPGESDDTFRLIGLSVTAMLERALVLKVSVPATLQLVQVAAGRMDAFWQFSAVRSGLLAGALLTAEAGGTVTDAHGQPWTLSSEHFLASAPGVHRAATEVLLAVR
jgi:myo-inositol-1(or 4)-monophosphatase